MGRKEKMEPDSVQMGIRLPRELLKEAQAVASAQDRTVASIVRLALKEWLVKHGESGKL